MTSNGLWPAKLLGARGERIRIGESVIDVDIGYENILMEPITGSM